jgi:bacillithiol synthase
MRIVAKDVDRSSLHERLMPFLGISFQAPDAMERASTQLRGHEYPRLQLFDLLYRYNVSIGNDTIALKQLERLKSSDSACVFTGQQLGFMGGPAYTILKGVTCLLVARAAHAIPIFWLATEDHDIAEIDHAYLIDTLGNLQQFRLSLPKDGRFVEDLFITPENREIIQQFVERVRIPQDSLPEWDASYALTMARFLAKQFAGTGMIFLEPRLLRPLSISFFRREIEESEAILEVLRETTSRVEASGGTTLLQFKEGTNLFFKEKEGYRRKIRKTNHTFLVGSKQYSQEDLLHLIENEPERLSTNVAARPVLQSLLFPTLAYVAGPSEFAYFRQLGDYHRFHQVPMPCIFPRISATMIPPYAETLLKKCHLEPWEKIPHHWIEWMPSLEDDIKAMIAEWQQSAANHFHEDIPADIMLRFVRLGARKVQRKVCKSRLRQREIPSYALHLLRNLLHPKEASQERVLNWWGFQAYSSENLITEFLKIPNWQTIRNLYCYVS